MNQGGKVIKITIQLFYFLKIYLFGDYALYYFNEKKIVSEEWLWPVKWLSYFSNPNLIIWGIVSVGIILSILSICYPFKRLAKIGEGILFFLFVAVVYSHGKIDHALHGVLYSTFFIALISKEINFYFLMRGAISIFSFPYFLAGLWKLRYVWEVKSYEMIASVLPHQLATNIVEGGKETALALKIINLSSSWHFSLWMGVILFELLAIVSLFRLNFFRAWGIALILFHFVTFQVMGIEFLEAQILCLIFLFYIWSTSRVVRFS